MTDLMYETRCQLCMKETDCGAIKFTWMGIDSLIYSCQPCESLIHFVALTELRKIRDRVAARLEKARKEESE